jgi:hypothetical protein
LNGAASGEQSKTADPLEHQAKVMKYLRIEFSDEAGMSTSSFSNTHTDRALRSFEVQRSLQSTLSRRGYQAIGHVGKLANECRSASI